ncbi:cupin domain-containing protein [Nordella sp. HKS 07]|uniref:cupin domain-containing protein n=1 Tax=Nordella sp. HKS 07 TaxID=2712222 RepID=UPI00352CDD1F
MTGPIDFSTFVAHWRDIEGSEDQHYSGSDERQSFSASFCETHGLMRLGVHHERLPPGRRLSWPHAEADEEEFVFVLEGEPDLWADGHVKRLKPDMGVSFPAGTGLAHTFLNNTEREIRLLVIGEASRERSRIHFPLDPRRNEEIGMRHWKIDPVRPLGPHDGLPHDTAPADQLVSACPVDFSAFVDYWRDIEGADDTRYNGSDELHTISASFGEKHGLMRLGIHHERLKPGRRASWPHAEADEEEFVFVVEGEPDLWADGYLKRLRPGDGASFPAGTGLAHTFLNNTDRDVRLVVVGEATRSRSRLHYPMHPRRNAEIGERHWRIERQAPPGPHDGLPDRLREKSRSS